MLQPVRLSVRASSSYVNHKQLTNMKIGFLGVPFGKGQKKGGIMERGLEAAPDALRATSLFKELQSQGIDIKDFGNISYKPLDHPIKVPNMINIEHVIPHNQSISDQVAEILKDGRTCLTIGGDHSIFTGTVHGHMRAAGAEEVAVVYIDAHADINLSNTSLSGNIHGMSVGMVAQELQSQWAHIPQNLLPKLSFPLNNLGYIALRSVDPPEQEILEKHGVAAYTIHDVVGHGVAQVLDKVLKRIDPDSRKSIHLSIDTDCLDPLEAPATTLPGHLPQLKMESLKIIASRQIQKSGK